MSEESYFDLSGTKSAEVTEKVWCKIGERGDLEYADWEMIERFAKKFDTTSPAERTQELLIGKLMWLVRQRFEQPLTGQSQ